MGLEVEIDELTSQLNRQQNDLLTLQTKLARWVRSQSQNTTLQSLNEIAYLLDVANLYLQINHDRRNAIVSLQLAQQHLQTLADPTLLSLQQAITSDLNHLNDSPQINLVDILLKLQTLNESISRLNMSPNPSTPSSTTTPVNNTPAHLSWHQRLLNLLSIRYQHVSEPLKILPAQQRNWVYDNISFTLAETQWAVLQQKQDLFLHSSTLVRQWLVGYYPDSPDRKNILQRLEDLKKTDIAPDLPDINHSLQAVHQAIKNIPESTPPPVQPPILIAPKNPTVPENNATPPEQTPQLPSPPTGVEI